MSDKPNKSRSRGRPPKSKTIFAKQTEEPHVESVTKAEVSNEIVIPSVSESVSKPEPIAEQKTESVTESVKIPIKIPKKRGKKAEPQGKILTIIDEPIPPKAEAPLPLKVDPPKEVTVVEPPSQKGLKAKKLPKESKPKPVKPLREPKPKAPPKRDEDLYRMVYALQQSLQQTKPKKKVVQYDSTDTDSASSSDISDDEEPDEKYTRKVQKRLATVQQIEKKLTQARQPKGKYDHLSIF